MRPHDATVVHVLYRFEFGGVQSLLAQCIRRMQGSGLRHVIICVADADVAALRSLGEVEVLVLNKPQCGAWRSHLRLFKHLRCLRPAIVQTYNISAIEYAVTAALAGVARRLHAEHGRGMAEYGGEHKRYNRLRRVVSPFIDTFITVSDDLASWLRDTVGIASHKVALISNGIDIVHFQPRAKLPAAPYVIGTVGRLDAIKAQADLIDAFIVLHDRFSVQGLKLYLTIIGEGPLAQMLAERIRAAGMEESISMPGARSDIAALMATFSVFVLPSLSEGTPMTLLEAMASGVPVVASAVGGIPALLGNDARGTRVPPSSPLALADAIGAYVIDPALAGAHAVAARRFVAAHYDVANTAAAYQALYCAAPSRGH
jgi:sugar transferase (PEP-CTERM/EpsH1 system associated)